MAGIGVIFLMIGAIAMRRRHGEGNIVLTEWTHAPERVREVTHDVVLRTLRRVATAYR